MADESSLGDSSSTEEEEDEDEDEDDSDSDSDLEDSEQASDEDDSSDSGSEPDNDNNGDDNNGDDNSDDNSDDDNGDDKGDENGDDNGNDSSNGSSNDNNQIEGYETNQPINVDTFILGSAILGFIAGVTVVLKEEAANSARILNRAEVHAKKVRYKICELEPSETSDFKNFCAGDNSDLAYFKYIGFSKDSFLELVALCQPLYDSLPMDLSGDEEACIHDKYDRHYQEQIQSKENGRFDGTDCIYVCPTMRHQR